MASKPQRINKITLDDCVATGTDLSDGYIYLIIYFPHSFPGMEYEILCEQRQDYLLLEKGDPITVYSTPTVRTEACVAAVKTDIFDVQSEYDFLVERRKKFNEAYERRYKEFMKSKAKSRNLNLGDTETERTDSTERSSDEEKQKPLACSLEHASSSKVTSAYGTRRNRTLRNTEMERESTEWSSDEEKYKKFKEHPSRSKVTSPYGALRNHMFRYIKTGRKSSQRSSDEEEYKKIKEQTGSSKIASPYRTLRNYMLRDSETGRKSSQRSSDEEECKEHPNRSKVTCPYNSIRNHMRRNTETERESSERSSDEEKYKKLEEQTNKSKITFLHGTLSKILRDVETQRESSGLSSDEEKHNKLKKENENSTELISVLLKVLNDHKDNNNVKHCICQNQSLPLETCNESGRRLNSQDNHFESASTSSRNTTWEMRPARRLVLEGSKENEKNCKCWRCEEEDFVHTSSSSSVETRGKRPIKRVLSESDKENLENYKGKEKYLEHDPTMLPNKVKKRRVSQEVFSDDDEENMENCNGEIKIGSGGTPIPKKIFDKINWTKHTAATRKLLMAVFPREVLATHSLTGKPSPAFLNSGKETKMRLDPSKINDIVETVSRKCKISPSMVRNAITTKCADENKLYRKRLKKNGICKEASDVANTTV